VRELTFSGFLTTYVRNLSAEDTNSIARLTCEAATTNARLREPLLLYAFWSGKADTLQRSAEKYGLREFYGQLLSADRLQLENALCNGLLPSEYLKVWNSYLRRRDRHLADDDTKALMRQRILALQEAKGVSNYRIYTDLRINPGNLNAWLKHGDCGKVSLKTARTVLQYVKS